MVDEVDYLCAMFGDFSFSHFGFDVRTDRQTDRITEADDRYIHGTTVGVSTESATVSSPVSIQTQSLALRKRKRQETQALALASSQSWLSLLRPSIPIG